MSVPVDVCKPFACLSKEGGEYEVLDAILGRAVCRFVGHVEFNALCGNRTEGGSRDGACWCNGNHTRVEIQRSAAPGTP